MKKWLNAAAVILAFARWASTASAAEALESKTSVLLVIGAVGEPDFATNFLHQADGWQKACLQAGCRESVIGRDQGTNDYERLKLALATEPKDGPGEFWLVFVGHGSFDGKEARFNLRGPDVSASEIAEWLKPFHRPLVVIDTSSCSAPFINKLSATNRVIITATRSGNEQNFARFGQYFAEALTSPDADLDKDGQVSLLEAFLLTSRRVAEFYKLQSRLVTEHALLDDNGDGLGTPADWFHGVRAVKKPKENSSVDGLFANQFHLVPSSAESALSPAVRARRDALEREVFALRDKKSQLPEEEYYRRLESLLLDLARIAATNSPAATNPQPVSAPP